MVVGRTEMHATWLGRVPYCPTFDLQRSLVAQRQSGEVPDTLLLLEHDHVVTLGRRADETHLASSSQQFEDYGVEVIETDRGGEATYHGPGQLVAYPIISVRELKMGPVAYVRILEETIIQVLRDHGIRGHRVVGKTGIWVDGEPGAKPSKGENPIGRKIAAIGVRLSGGVAMHGMALNVTTDLTYYDHFIPCGMPDLNVTSIEKEIGTNIDVEDVARDWATAFADILFFEIDWRSASEFGNIQSEKALISV